MNLSELLSKGLIERFQSNQEQIENQMKIAMRDVSSAKNMLQIGEWEWAYNATYTRYAWGRKSPDVFKRL